MSYRVDTREMNAGRNLRTHNPRWRQTCPPAGATAHQFELVIYLRPPRRSAWTCDRRCSPAPTR